MSTLNTANIAFESTDKNQIYYANTKVNIASGTVGNTFFSSNSSLINIKLGNPLINNANTSATQTYTTDLAVQNFTSNGQIILAGNVSPASLSANTADWNPSFGSAYLIRVTSSANVLLYGMVAGSNGQAVVLNNIGSSVITLRNEDVVNETTASRRFLLPNNLNLFPYSSISLIYDGLSSRWKVNGNIDTNNFYKASATKGFFAGGNISPGTGFNASNTVCKIDYSSEVTSSAPTAQLSVVRADALNFGTSNKGFLTGGTTTCVFVSSSARIGFSSETSAAVSGASLSQARTSGAGSGNSNKGYAYGGSTSPAKVTTIDRTLHNTETTAAAGFSLTTARSYNAGVGTECKGFTLGGAVPVNNTEKINYNTETVSSVPGANLINNRTEIASAGNADKGFITGAGQTGPALAWTCRVTYSSETTASVPTAFLPNIRSAIRGTGSNCKGFFTGDQGCYIVGCPPFCCVAYYTVNCTYRINYATEVSAAVTPANLTTGRGRVNAV